MDDVLKRLGAVESIVSEIRSQVSAIAAILPHLATKADLSAAVGGLKADLGAAVGGLKADLGAAVGGLKADLSAAVGGLKADLGEQVGSLRADLTEKLGSLENRLVKWTIGIIIAVAGLAFTIGKYGH